MQNTDVLFIHDNGFRSVTEGMWKAVHKPTGKYTSYYQDKATALSILEQIVDPSNALMQYAVNPDPQDRR